MNESNVSPAILRTIACALAAVFPVTAGCSFLERPAPTGSQYLMKLPAQAPVAGAKLGTAMVTRFSAIPPFDERRFLYKTTDGSWRLDAYNGFMSDPSDMLCDAFARALEQSGRFTMVGIEGVSVRCDVTLDGVIEGFYADYTGSDGPAAVVEVRAYLLDGRGARTRLVGQLLGRGRAPIEGQQPGDVASAFSAASAQAIDAVVRGLPPELAPLPVEATKPAAAAQSNRPHEGGAASEEIAVQPQNAG